MTGSMVVLAKLHGVQRWATVKRPPKNRGAESTKIVGIRSPASCREAQWLSPLFSYSERGEEDGNGIPVMAVSRTCALFQGGGRHDDNSTAVLCIFWDSDIAYIGQVLRATQSATSFIV